MNSLQEKFRDRLLLNESMSRHSTLRLGGPAKYFLDVKNADEVIKAIEAAKQDGINCAVIGGGSNILVSDSGFNGLVIRMSDSEMKIDGEKIYAGAGVFSVSLARGAYDAGLSGLEWMATLPGRVGGAVYGNAGAYGEETKDKLERVLVLDGAQKKWLQKEDCAFGYRASRFKKTKEVILGAEFVLRKGELGAIKEKMDKLLGKRKDEQPLGASSAGCIFKNFKFSSSAKASEDRQISDLPRTELALVRGFKFDIPEEFLKNKTIPAGWLIDKAGMKGFCIGKTGISERHGNFSITKNGATADELIQLISAVKMKVRDTFGIELEEEVQYIGFRKL